MVAKNLLYSILAALCAASLLAGCGADNARDGESTLSRIQRTGVVRVGYANEAPYAYKDSSTRSLTGEAPEILRRIFDELGVAEVEGVLTEFGSLIPGLKARRFDIIAAGMYITPERCAEVAFTNPTYSVGEAFIVKAGNPSKLHSYEGLRDHSDAKLGVVAGTVERKYARGVGIPDPRVVVFPDAPSALAGVQAGHVDAYAGTSRTVQDLLDKARSDELERAEPFTDPVINGEPVRGYGAFAVRKDDRELLTALNEQLAAFIGTEEHQALVQPFGFTENELPGDMTASRLCAPDANEK